MNYLGALLLQILVTWTCHRKSYIFFHRNHGPKFKRSYFQKDFWGAYFQGEGGLLTQFYMYPNGHRHNTFGKKMKTFFVQP